MLDAIYLLAFLVGLETIQPRTSEAHADSLSSLVLSGCVRSETGTPLAATLRVVPWVDGGEKALEPVEAKAATDGRFRLAITLPGLGRRHLLLALRIDADGHAPRFEELSSYERALRPGEVIDFGNLELEVGATITGRVVAGAEVRPIEGASVSLSLHSAIGLDTVHTGADGRFSFAHVSRRGALLRVVATGFAAARMPLGDLGSDRTRDVGLLRLEPGWELEGQVVDPSGDPIVDATVRPVAWERPGPSATAYDLRFATDANVASW